MAKPASPADFTAFTEEHPAAGCVAVGDVLISAAERWYEDGLHVIQSTEFDCSAQDENPRNVLAVFIENALDLADLLYDLKERGEATDHEQEVLALLGGRFARLAREYQREQRQRGFLRHLRSRGEHTETWRQRDKVLIDSSLPSRA